MVLYNKTRTRTDYNFRDKEDEMMMFIFTTVSFVVLIDFLISIVWSTEIAMALTPIVSLLGLIVGAKCYDSWTTFKKNKAKKKAMNKHTDLNVRGFHKPDWTYEWVACMCAGIYIPIGPDKYKLAVPEEEIEGSYKRVCDVCGLMERR